MGSNLTPQDIAGTDFNDELKPGTSLLHGQYVIERFLNHGGFGITYLAKDSLHRRVVIKECFPESMCSRVNSTVRIRSRNQAEVFRGIVEMFVEEARNLARLSHPNIVGVHQVFEDNETAYMAMDFVEGRDLLAIAEGTETIAPEAIERIVLKLLDAIGFIHKEGVLHRDISPDNILLSQDNEPVLIDFGAARDNVSRAASYLASMRTVKDGYSPQEFYVNTADQHPSSDLYSLAASLYHVMTKKLPVSAQTRMVAIAGGDDDPYTSIKDLVSGHPEPFLDAIDLALKVFPKERLQSAAEWRALITGEDYSAQPNGAVSRPMLAAENGSVLEQFEGKTPNQPAQSGHPVTPRAVRPKSPAHAPKREGDHAISQSLRDAAVVGKPSSGKGLYLGVAAVALLAVVAGGAFLLTGGDIAQSEETAVAAAPQQAEPADAPSSTTVATTTPPNATSTTPTDSRKPEQVPFFLAETSEGDVTVSSASGTLSPGDNPVITTPPPRAEQQTEPVAATGPSDDLASDPQRPTETASAEPERAPSPATDVVDVSWIITGKAVRFPVEADAADPTLIAAVSGPMADILEPGQRVLSVNGFPIDALSDFQLVVQATSDFAVGDTVEITLGIQDTDTSDTFVQSVELPGVKQIMLLNGTGFQTIRDGEGWSTLVTSGSGQSQTDLQAGDRIVALMPDNELIEGEDGFGRVLQRELDKGTTQFNFAVLRDGEMWLAGMRYATGSGN